MKTVSNSTIEQLKMFVRHKYAFPGGYPMYLVTHDGASLCHACTRDNFKLIMRATRQGDCESGWMAFGMDINYEDPALYCDHCGERIESAYAEPDHKSAPAGTILVSQTYEVAPPDAESEDDLETGFEFRARAVTFHELIELMEAHPEPSTWPCPRADGSVWFTSPQEQDYRTGAYRTTSIFFDDANPARKVKYWNLAARIAHRAR